MIPASKASIFQQLRQDAENDFTGSMEVLKDATARVFTKFTLRQKFGPPSPDKKEGDEVEGKGQKSEAEAEGSEAQHGQDQGGVQGEGEKGDGPEKSEKDDAKSGVATPGSPQDDFFVAVATWASRVKGHRDEDVDNFVKPGLCTEKDIFPFLPYACWVSMIYFADLISLTMLEKRLHVADGLSVEEEMKFLRRCVLFLEYSEALVDISNCPKSSTGATQSCIVVHLTLGSIRNLNT